MTGHSHSPRLSGEGTATSRFRRRLMVVLVITWTVMLAEIAGSLLSGSLALLADAGHMLADGSGIAIALFANWLASRPTTSMRTFGWQRAEIIAALANGLIVLGLAVTVVVEGIGRLRQPPESLNSTTMIVVAVIGLIANGIGIMVLSKGRSESLNVRGAYLEVFGDLLGSIAVIAAGILVATGMAWADGAASVAIGLMIAPRAVLLLRDVIRVLLEQAPQGVDMAQVRDHMEKVDGVVGVHDLHAWTITSGVPVMSAHIEVSDWVIGSDRQLVVLHDLKECLRGHFDVDHCTFQIEPWGMGASEEAAHR